MFGVQLKLLQLGMSDRRVQQTAHVYIVRNCVRGEP
jgi:hypothetical protein